MILNLTTENGKRCGVLELQNGGAVHARETLAPELQALIDRVVAVGVPTLLDFHKPDRSEIVMAERLVPREDPVFPLALKQYLERKGYRVEIAHPEVDAEIEELLATFPDDNPDKRDILARLPAMTHLEKTAILEGLRNLDEIPAEDSEPAG